MKQDMSVANSLCLFEHDIVMHRHSDRDAK